MHLEPKITLQNSPEYRESAERSDRTDGKARLLFLVW